MFGLFITNVVALLVGAIIVFKLINIATKEEDDKENDKGDYVYDSVICTNQFGVRFRVVLRDILEKKHQKK